MATVDSQSLDASTPVFLPDDPGSTVADVTPTLRAALFKVGYSTGVVPPEGDPRYYGRNFDIW